MKMRKLFGLVPAALAAVLLTGGASVASELPGGYTCSDIRTTVASYGASVVLAAARGRGIPEKDIARIRQQCRV